ncbi:dihydroxyacetone kinase subunit DhaL [Klebsiella quasipneumoniae]|uniref:dihydroxyacetone kinase subunit DhaL n=1 Tax=Klebsiella quasipneumoniae TaxID=1463165 RepID=UPI000CEC2B03|nr:dihydroxyacetone kinase subunit DhaL [Klebsiella quasipneumoniae]ROC60482.1 dihydroxyacetone kinase subunit L [Klebsiella quasipneumoniae subsp. quasipneumoniae]
MNVEQVCDMMIYTSQGMVASEPHLTELDQQVGDGDHGFGIQRGFQAGYKMLSSSANQYADVGELFVSFGTTLMATMGGASGAIFGTFFRAGGKALVGKKEFDTPALIEFLTAGRDGVFQRGKAEPGDKTMMDALYAAVDAFPDKDALIALPKALEIATDAAEQGALKTKYMIAKFGRAKSLGQRTIGHCDPGAVSMSLILKYMSEYLNKKP